MAGVMLWLLSGVYGRVVNGQAAPNSKFRRGALPCAAGVLGLSIAQFDPAIAQCLIGCADIRLASAVRYSAVCHTHRCSTC